MRRMPRREALVTIAGVVAAGGCGIHTIVTELPGKQNPFTRWKKAAASVPAWKKMKDRYATRLKECARPYLTVPPILSSRGPLAQQLRAFGPNEDGEISFWVHNEGDGASWTCVAEVYEGHWSLDEPYGQPIEEFRRTGTRVIALQPAEQREVVVPWRLQRLHFGRIVLACYDPMLDPRTAGVTEQFNRQSTGIHWADWSV